MVPLKQFSQEPFGLGFDGADIILVRHVLLDEKAYGAGEDLHLVGVSLAVTVDRDFPVGVGLRVGIYEVYSPSTKPR